jgi:CRP-like cAMP-binding protein
MQIVPAIAQAAAPVPGNALLRFASEADRRAVHARGHRVDLVAGATFGIRGDAPACFPEDAVLSVGDRSGIEVGLIGAEGMCGWTALLSGFHHPLPCTVERGGPALVVPAGALAEVCAASPALRELMMLFSATMTAQMAASIIAATGHGLRARLCRRLLMLHDRCSGDSITLTHAHVARQLGVRRASVTDALHLLEGERVVRSTRNTLEVRDRAGLERMAGSAYGSAERAYRAMLGPFGR